MNTLGIDLAAKPKKTAACLIEWTDGAAAVRLLESGLDDPALVELCGRADKVAIDAPFGWPDEFVAAVVSHRDFLAWPGAGEPPDEFRARLSFRATDRAVEPVRRPLSVSTDKIGVTAMRCASLLDQLGEVDRAGFGKVVEVYPAAALERWRHQAGRYKAKLAGEALPRMVDALTTALPGLDLGGTDPSKDDDVFDALVSALVARAAARGLTDPPPEELRAQAAREGWIHLPRAGSLGELM